MDDNDLSIEKREPGFFASLFGAEPETVLVNKDGGVVGKIETEEPGFFGSLVGEESKQIIVNEDGDKVATFEKETPGFFASLMGEKEKTVLVDEDGDKLASFDKEEPGLLAGLLGEKAKNILVDKHGDKLATFEKEEPGFIGKLVGDKAKRLIRADPERADEIRRVLSRKKASDTSTEEPEPECSDDCSHSPYLGDDDDGCDGSAVPEGKEEDEDAVDEVLLEDGDEVTYQLASGAIQIHSRERTSSGFNITIITYKSREEYDWHQRLLKMFREMDEGKA